MPHGVPCNPLGSWQARQAAKGTAQKKASRGMGAALDCKPCSESTTGGFCGCPAEVPVVKLLDGKADGHSMRVCNRLYRHRVANSEASEANCEEWRLARDK